MVQQTELVVILFIVKLKGNKISDSLKNALRKATEIIHFEALDSAVCAF